MEELDLKVWEIFEKMSGVQLPAGKEHFPLHLLVIQNFGGDGVWEESFSYPQNGYPHGNEGWEVHLGAAKLLVV